MRSISVRGVVSVTQNNAAGQFRIEVAEEGPLIFFPQEFCFPNFPKRGIPRRIS